LHSVGDDGTAIENEGVSFNQRDRVAAYLRFHKAGAQWKEGGRGGYRCYEAALVA